MTADTAAGRLRAYAERGVPNSHLRADLRAVLDEREQMVADKAEMSTALANVILVASRQGGEIATLMDGYMPGWRTHIAARIAAETPPVPCVYFDQPGHTPGQKPHPDVYEGGFDSLPLCPACKAVIDAADARRAAAERELADARCECGCVPGRDCGCGFACPRCSPDCPVCDRDEDQPDDAGHGDATTTEADHG